MTPTHEQINQDQVAQQPVEDKSTKPSLDNVQEFAKIQVRERALIFLLLAGALINSVLAGPFWVTCLLWGIPLLISRARMFITSLLKSLKREKTVPIHVEYAINRIGEYVMVMLGESIISIIITGLTPSANFIGTYFLCYFLVATLSLLIFGAQPTHADQHAMRRNASRAIFFFMVFSIQAMALICIGVGFKLILTSSEEKNEKLLPYVWLISVSLVVEVCAVFVSRVLHHGFNEEFTSLSVEDRVKKLVFWTLKLIGTLTFLAAPFMNAPSWGLMLFFWLDASFLYFIQLLDIRAFRDHHGERIQREVEARIAQFEKEGLNVTKHGDSQQH